MPPLQSQVGAFPCSPFFFVPYAPCSLHVLKIGRWQKTKVVQLCVPSCEARCSCEGRVLGGGRGETTTERNQQRKHLNASSAVLETEAEGDNVVSLKNHPSLYCPRHLFLIQEKAPPSLSFFSGKTGVHGGTCMSNG